MIVIRGIIAIAQALTQVSVVDVVTFLGGVALFAGLWMFDPRVALVAIGALMLALGLSARFRRWLV